ncbi:GNAT family N-acetyltransferase [Mangrovimicrobium sediminis]|uniref:GNAT family N-acetyltransferase n=1 Tax=Mangrovimicrobium sediminis TaxID=2562682 RepID=A0A4Z0MAB8_9GAMM|nr:GNAT family N-acetyltransferase [Haliea sp. SAOS-164]TGD76245.1 GNAT family N-acetyltransferase [Haliea sp. SAOS-164]
MREQDFEQFLVASATGYAEDNIRSGRWPRENAHDRAMSELKESLPQGIATPDNHFFSILACPDGAIVGHIWCAVRDNVGQRSAFIYDVEIKPEFRRQGYASDAFVAIQERLATMDVQSLGLHVFAFNEGAITLYKKLGFEVTGFNMQKELGAQES